MIDLMGDYRIACSRWPGAICSVCWTNCCILCRYSFDDPRDAAARDESGSLLCASCAPEDGA